MSEIQTKVTPRTVEDIDEYTRKAVDAYVGALLDALQDVDAPPLETILLYGSRARGDHTDESDADLAIVLKGRDIWRSRQILWNLGEQTCLAEADYDCLVSPRVFWSEVLSSPASSSNPTFYRNLLSDGIAWTF